MSSTTTTTTTQGGVTTTTTITVTQTGLSAPFDAPSDEPALRRDDVRRARAARRPKRPSSDSTVAHLAAEAHLAEEEVLELMYSAADADEFFVLLEAASQTARQTARVESLQFDLNREQHQIDLGYPIMAVSLAPPSEVEPEAEAQAPAEG